MNERYTRIWKFPLSNKMLWMTGIPADGNLWNSRNNLKYDKNEDVLWRRFFVCDHCFLIFHLHLSLGHHFSCRSASYLIEDWKFEEAKVFFGRRFVICSDLLFSYIMSHVMDCQRGHHPNIAILWPLWLTMGHDHSLRKLSIKSSLARPVSEPILKVGWNFWDLLFPSLKFWQNFRIWNKVCTWDMLSWIPDRSMQG